MKNADFLVEDPLAFNSDSPLSEPETEFEVVIYKGGELKRKGSKASKSSEKSAKIGAKPRSIGPIGRGPLRVEISQSPNGSFELCGEEAEGHSKIAFGIARTSARFLDENERRFVCGRCGKAMLPGERFPKLKSCGHFAHFECLRKERNKCLGCRSGR